MGYVARPKDRIDGHGQDWGLRMITLSSRIDAVQVYRRGATVTRVAELTLEGQQALPDEVELIGLPLSLLDPTARVRVLAAQSEPGVDVVAAGVRVGLWARPGDPPPKAPAQEELEETQRKIARVREQLDQVEREVNLLAGVSVPERPQGEDGKAPPASPMAARLQLEQFVDEATRQRLVERRGLREQLRQLEEDEARIRERIAAASTANEVKLDELQKSVTVRLRSRGAPPRKLTLELSYVVPGARWAPAYQCKLARDGSKAEIQLRAWVAQRTGEDWKGVRLRLSTAAPLRFSELPELSSIRIGRAQPAPAKRGFRAPPQGGEVLFRDHDRDLQRARELVPRGSGWRMPELPAPHDLSPHPPAQRAERKKYKSRARHAHDEPTGSGDADLADKSSMMVGAMPESAALDEEADLMMDSLGADDMEMSEAVVAAPAPAPAAPAAPMRSMAYATNGGPGGGQGAGAARSVGALKREVAAKPRAPDDVLNALMYPLLRLPGPQDGNRGRLVPVDVRSLYGDSLARIGRPFRFDVVSAVQHAEEVAMSVVSIALPDGTVDADDISSHFDFAYEADGVVEVVADGGFHSIALGDRASDARMRYIAVPREEAAVYRVAMLTNPVPAPLLPGPAEVYVGGEYVLTTRLPTVPARGELKLGLGVEQAIKIARNTKYSEVRSGEKVVAMTELVHDIDIDVVNHLEREIDIEVRERVPIPAAGAEVVVEESAVEPVWQPYDQEERGQPIEGGRRWEVKVPKGGTQKLKGRYVVKIYANNEIAGGNRREA